MYGLVLTHCDVQNSVILESDTKLVHSALAQCHVKVVHKATSESRPQSWYRPHLCRSCHWRAHSLPGIGIGIPLMPSVYLSCLSYLSYHLCDNPSHKSHVIMKYAGQEGQQTFNASFIIAPLPPVPRYKFCFKICFLEQQNASEVCPNSGAHQM